MLKSSALPPQPMNMFFYWSLSRRWEFALAICPGDEKSGEKSKMLHLSWKAIVHRTLEQDFFNVLVTTFERVSTHTVKRFLSSSVVSLGLEIHRRNTSFCGIGVRHTREYCFLRLGT